MTHGNWTRRLFLGSAATVATTAAAAPPPPEGNGGTLAVLGGKPVRSARWPSWPRIGPLEETRWMEVLRSGHWGRGSGRSTERFEQAYAELTGARHCLATANGTSALITALNALGVDAGDEVIVPPYTFVATLNVVLLQHAVPVFVDTDRETFQMDAKKLEAAITPRTAAIVPVHLGGNVCDLDAILEIARRRNIPVVEDACQAHLAEWKGRKVGVHGAAGCFSFQASKNLNCGEGGALVTDDAALLERAFTFHNNGRGRVGDANFRYRSNGANLRLTEFGSTLLLAQMTRLEEQSKRREENAAYLNRMLAEIPGIRPARQYPGTTRNAYHLYMFRYDAREFAGAPRSAFLKALHAEGVPCSGGYAPLHREPFLAQTLARRGYRRLLGERYAAEWMEKNRCPENDLLCEEAVWLVQTMLLGERRDMEQIVEAVRKIRAHAAALARV